jgi:hypothetical protein
MYYELQARNWNRSALVPKKNTFLQMSYLNALCMQTFLDGLEMT